MPEYLPPDDPHADLVGVVANPKKAAELKSQLEAVRKEGQDLYDQVRIKEEQHNKRVAEHHEWLRQAASEAMATVEKNDAAAAAVAQREATLDAARKAHDDKATATNKSLDERADAIKKREDELAKRLQAVTAREAKLTQDETHVATLKAELERNVAYYKAGPH